MKKWLNKRGGLSWGHNLAVFYYFSASDIRPDKSGGLWWKGPYKRGTNEPRN